MTRKDRRYATTLIIRRKPRNEDDIPTRPFRKNPASTKAQQAKVRRWWKSLTQAERQTVVSKFLGTRRNPPSEAETYRALGRAMAAMERANRTRGRRHRRHVRDYDRWIGKTKRNPKAGGKRTPSDRDWRGYAAVKRALKRNPKRDGSPTRGEKRRVKYAAYLQSVVANGQQARAAMERMMGEIANLEKKVYGTVGKRAEKRLLRLSADDYAEAKGVTKAEAREVIAEAAAPVVLESDEVKFIKSQLHDVDVLMKDSQAQLAELDADDDLNDTEIGMIHREIEKLARRKKQLNDKLSSLSVATNPRRGRVRRCRLPAESKRRLRAAVSGLARSIRDLRRIANRR